MKKDTHGLMKRQNQTRLRAPLIRSNSAVECKLSECSTIQLLVIMMLRKVVNVLVEFDDQQGDPESDVKISKQNHRHTGNTPNAPRVYIHLGRLPKLTVPVGKAPAQSQIRSFSDGLWLPVCAVNCHSCSIRIAA